MKPPTKARFNYPAHYDTMPEYTKHAGQVVTVVREGNENDAIDVEDVGTMYLIRADDGWEGFAFEEELEELA